MNFKFLLLIVFSTLMVTTAVGQGSMEKEHKVKVTTVFGDMIIKLYNDTPIHRDNFIKNVKNGWYDGTLFHRVIRGFMAQGGDPNSIDATPEQNLGSDRCVKLPAEIRRNHFHKKGAIAAARLPDGMNPERESSGCQFFVVQGYQYNDQQLTAMENENFKFSDFARAYYTAVGGAPHLDMQYSIFGEVIEGLDIIDLIAGMPVGKHSMSRPNTDIVMKVEMINE